MKSKVGSLGEIIERKIRRMNWKAKIAILCFTLISITFMYEGWHKPRPAHAAVTTYKGTFTKFTSGGGAGIQQITGVGFQPKAVIFFWTKNTTDGTAAANGVMGIGFAGGSPIANSAVVTSSQDNVGTTNTGWMESATYSIVTLDPATQGLAARASVSDLYVDGFTLYWQNSDASADIIHYIAIGDTDITNVKVGQFSGPAATGNFSYTGVGFQPDFVMLAFPDGQATTLDGVRAAGALNIGMFTSTSQGAIGWGSRDDQTAITHAHVMSDANSVYGIRGNAADQVATFVSMDANGFTLNYTTAGSSAPCVYIALKGGVHKIGSFTKRTSAGTQAVTGVGFQPTALMLFSHNSAATNGTVETADPAASMSIGAATGAGVNGTVWMHERTVINTDVNMISHNNLVMRMGASNDGITDYGQATLQSFDTDGFSLNWTTSDGTARKILYWAMGSNPDTTPPTADAVNVTPSANGYTSSSPAIATQFTDSESGVTSCEYTTNGTTWAAGTLSGSSPVWTCTANPTGLSGTLTINMRATSEGGTGTATAVTRIADTTGPTDGTLSAIAGNGQVGLEWTSATDAGIGLATTNTYKVVRATGAAPPANCSGAGIYQGTAPNYTDKSVINDTTYSYRVCAYDKAGNVSAGINVTATPSARTGKIASCSQCHDYPPQDSATRNNPAGAIVGDHQKHLYVCSTCHVTPATETFADYNHRNGQIQMRGGATGVSGGYYDKNNSGAYEAGTDDTWQQTNTPTTASCRNISCHGGNNPTPQWGVGTVGCVDCHNGVIPAANASAASGGTVTQRDNVVAEFGLAWGHKKSGRGAVTDSDCIVCHLEGNYTTQRISSYHADGYIDLRDPDGAGETRITDISGTSFRFVQFSTSYAAGSRTPTGHLSNNTDNVLTRKFCVACHDSNGASNTTARTTYGTPTYAMPFGGVNLGANYTTTNDAIAAGGTINVAKQFATTNSSAHPVLGPRLKDYPLPSRLASPYNNIATTPAPRANGAHNQTNSVVLNCFDCHTTGTSLTNRTIVAHGNTVTLRGTIYVATPTLCTSCHVGYNTTPGTDISHGGGSAGQWNGLLERATTNCSWCHSSTGTLTAPARPIAAQDYHGNNALVGGGLWPTLNSRPYAFIRGWQGTAYHRPYRSTEFTTGYATCGAGTCPGTGSQVGNGTDRTYNPGGSY